MRFRLILSTLAVCFLLVLAGALIVEAQTESLNKRNSSWESRVVIGLPGDDDSDDESDDEGDDEGCDCPPYPGMVRKTGQTRCWAYDYEFEYWHETDCAGTGEDGEFQRGILVDPRFTDNGDGTVTDNLTGLIWLRDSTCFGMRSWSDALSDANNLANGFCGLTDGSVAGDWRMSNVNELQSLVHYDYYAPAMPRDCPFIIESGAYFWTSTTTAYGSDAVWKVLIWNGNVHSGGKHFGGSYVWPVRGPE